MRSIFITAILIFASAIAPATAESPQRTQDDDLSSGPKYSPGEVSIQLAADRTEFQPGQDGLKILVFRMVKGQAATVEGLDFKPTSATSCATGADLTARATLQAQRFSVTQNGTPYFIDARSKCGTLRLYFESDSPGGQALGIWQVLQLAQTKLASAVGLAFWKSPIEFVFPADGDYYTYNQVHITRGDHWDVVGHELGHAIYDQGDIGIFGGGSHLIDACYTEALALSEGWASYFSAWLHVDLTDTDAKFEFMVPRRAPLRFENIPGDVCRGQTNEWRVTGFFWDLIDSNSDRETANFTFAQTWNALKGKYVTSAKSAMDAMSAAGMDAGLMREAWNASF